MNDLIYKRIAQLTPEKQRLLEKKLKEQGRILPAGEKIPRRKDPSRALLSYSQRRMWYLQQLNPLSPVYNNPFAFRLQGTLDENILTQSLQLMINRHETLRCTLVPDPEEPRWLIRASASVPLTSIDLRHLPNSDRMSHALKLIHEEARRLCDLTTGHLWRIRLFKLTEDDHILLVVASHLIMDGWSKTRFLEEIVEIYKSIEQGQQPILPELFVQYGDYAAWQRSFDGEDKWEKDLSYWQNQLSGCPSLELPGDFPRPPVITHRGARETVHIPASLGRELRRLAETEGVSLFMALLTVFSILLSRYSGQNDFAVGVPVAGRQKKETEPLIGCFINTLAVRVDLSGDPSFRQLIMRIKTLTLSAYHHQEFPFDKLVEALKPPRDTSRTPIFQTLFNLRKFPAIDTNLRNLSVQPISVDINITIVDLTLEMEEDGQGLTGFFEYYADLWNAGTIRRMVGHFQQLLHSALAEPNIPISQLSLMTEAEKQTLLVEWNNRTRDYPRHLCLHQFFEEWAARTPEYPAVVLDSRQLTYKDLNSRANRLARYLRKLGVGPDVLVGICMDRSLDMIMAMMGILKAGGAYLPLDPLYPTQRLVMMLEDARASVLLTLSDTTARPSTSGLRVICLDDDNNKISRESNQNLDNIAAMENLAYVMFTSGSTGRPKGVMIEHRNIVGLLHSYSEVTAIPRRQVGTSVATFSFDTSVAEIFGNLCFGGTLHIVRPEHSTDVTYFAKYLVENRITTSYILPDFLEGVANHLTSMQDRIALCCLITGLSPKKQRVLQRFRNLSRKLKIINAYGPTEITYAATTYTFHEAMDPDGETPIGVPFPNYRAYIVDPHFQPVPVGVAGELVIGGVGVARGYLNQPEATAEKFVSDPFSGKTGERLYKTGDLARYLPDGNIEFLGRMDNQVKIRGYRVELGEIETVMERHAQVKRAVVIVREDQPGEKRIVAYPVPHNGKKLSVTDLRNFLKEKLPEYMIPSAFMGLDVLPLMVNGKVDYISLPKPDTVRPDLESHYVAPRNDVEKKIIQIWQDLLLPDKVGIHDNFFDLGGHSLLAIRVISRIRSDLGLNLSILDLFANPTPARISEVITQQQTIDPTNNEQDELMAEISQLTKEEVQRELMKNEVRPGIEGHHEDS